MNSLINPFIVKVFEASSSHITGADDKLLKRNDLASLAVYSIKGGGITYGFLIYTGLDDDSTLSETEAQIGREDFYKSIRTEGYSDAMINLIMMAKRNGCKFLQLDCDGTEYDDLPTFDW
jgi:hypothetical protein